MHSPASVRTTPPLPNRGQHTVSAVKWNCRLATHIPWSAQGCRALPCECTHHPLLPSLGQHPHSPTLNVTVQARHTPPMVSPRMPCTPLRVCAPSSGFAIRATPSSMFSATPQAQGRHTLNVVGETYSYCSCCL